MTSSALSGGTTIVLLLSLFAAGLALASSGSHASREAIALQLETLENTVDGSVLHACRLDGEIEERSAHESWLAFGEIRQHEGSPLEVVSNAIRCRAGSSRKADALFGHVLGIPYLIADIEVSRRQGKVLASITRRKFSSWDKRGRPVYTSLERRTFEVASEVVLPIFVADSKEKEGFRIEEVLLRLRHGARAAGEAAYGSIALTSDTPGAFVLLDGGSVARALETGPTMIENVLRGRRELVLRDLSGREAHTVVEVEKERTVPVSLSLRDPASSASDAGFVAVGKNPQKQEEHWRVLDGALVVTIPGGEAWIGNEEGEGEDNEHPKHRVFVSDFRVDKTEVTWRQFRRFAHATGTPMPPPPVWGTPDDFPVSNVTWEEADAFCKWVGGRLLTEAEWEKANRGTDGRKYPWGKDWEPGRCNSFDGGPHRPESVGSFPECTSPYGVLDMPGSVWEWCSDWYAESYDPGATARDPHGPDSGSMRVVRGGGWVNQPTWLRAAYRYRAEPHGRHPNHGFRCAMSEP